MGMGLIEARSSSHDIGHATLKTVHDFVAACVLRVSISDVYRLLHR